MVSDVDSEVEAWLASSLATLKVAMSVSTLSPGASVAHEGVNVYLLSALPAPCLRGKARPPLQIDLRYLVTISHPDPKVEHRVFGELLAAAMEHAASAAIPKFDVEGEAMPAAVWTALQMVPRPALILRLSRERSRPSIKLPRLVEPQREPGQKPLRVDAVVVKR